MWPFTRLLVQYLPQGGTTVTWQLDHCFSLPAPWYFQLQVNEHNIPSYRADGSLRLDDNWINVANSFAGSTTTYAGSITLHAGNEVGGVLVVSSFDSTVMSLTDPEKESYGKLLNTFYRIGLTASGTTYYSDAALPFGVLNTNDWLIFNEIIRKEKLRNSLVAVPGYIFKAKRSGTPCPVCLDPNTLEVTDSKCPTCFGTRWAGGYYEAVPGCYQDLGLVQRSERRGDDQDPGMHLALVNSGRFSNIPCLVDMDLWVEKNSGLRHVIRPVETLAQSRGVPAIVKCELRQLEFSDVVYDLPLTGTP